MGGGYRLLAGVSLVAAVAQPVAAQTLAFNLPAGDLKPALDALVQQSGLQLVYRTEDVQAKRTQGVRGALRPEQALDMLLRGTGLVVRRDSSGAVMLGAEVVTQTEPDAVDASQDIIVTAQKREERIQDVPIAISAFSAKALDEQKIEGGFDLLRGIPNVTFSKNNYSGYNFSIRGVGTKSISATSDPGVAVSFNNVALIRNRLFEQEYLDVERVEVLRGPQGTLYGRNATAGVINVIPARPDANDFEASIKAEAGNYNARRLTGMINLPIAEDMLAIRIAGAMTKRDGYGFNLTTNNDTDNRDLWSTRVSIAVAPQSPIRARLTWEHFEEDDERLRTGKQLCHRDPGPSSVAGTTTNVDPLLLQRLSQGCKQGSLYDDAAFGAPNGNSIPFVVAGQYLGFLGYAQPFDPDLGFFTPRVSLLKRGLDPFGVEQSRNLREIESIRDGEYRAKADILAFDIDVDVTDALRFSSQTLYNKDEVYSLQDYNRFATRPIFNDSAGEVYNGFGDIYGDPALRLLPSDIAAITPGGIFCDPQIGCSDTIAGFEISSSKSKQFSQEVRLQSSFDGPVNFNLGGNYLWFEGLNDYYLFYNVVTLLAQGFYNRSNDPATCSGNAGLTNCMHVDTNPIGSLSGDGHNYFRNQNPYNLESTAAFGEIYWNVTPALKLTGGLRFTHDRKRFVPYPSQLLVAGRTSDLDEEPAGPGYEYGSEAPINQSWKEFTGRLGVDWKPDLSFTDDTMIYAFYSHGYKGGGANPPRAQYNDERYISGDVPALFDPEYVDAFEIGTKNVLLGGKLVLNATATHYKYKDYQVSKVVDRTIVNENFDAEIWSLEAEAVWNVTPRLRLNGNIGYLDTRVGDGERSIDIFNRNQGNPDWLVVTPWIQQTSNCILPTWLVARYLDDGLFPIPGFEAFSSIIQACTIYSGDPNGVQAPTYGFNPADYPEINNGAGFYDDLSGNELPNAPHWSFNLGAQYDMPIGPDWDVSLRGDYYRQAGSYARIYNLESDRLRAWDNLNLTLTVARPADGLVFQAYVKNVFDNTPITDAFLNSDSTGMPTNIFTLDPRITGFSVAKTF